MTRLRDIQLESFLKDSSGVLSTPLSCPPDISLCVRACARACVSVACIYTPPSFIQDPAENERNWFA